MGRFRVVGNDPAARTVTVVHLTDQGDHPVHLEAATLRFKTAATAAALPVGREMLLSFSLLSHPDAGGA